MAQSFAEFRGTPLWRAIAECLQELEATGEVKVQTAPDYVIGFLCQELSVKWVVASSALVRNR
jgi:hypothetical protein